MRIVLDFIKGIAIGISNIIPGFSGGTMALILGVYERIISAISEILSHPLKVIKEIGVILFGVLFGIIGSIFLIVKMLEVAPFITIMFFIGLIIGSIPFIKPSFKEYRIRFFDVITFIICLGLIIALPLIQSSNTSHELSFYQVIIIAIMGMISAGAMVVPGVSGSMILMALGYYTFIIGNIKDLLEKVFHGSFSGIGNDIIILIVFAIGVILGLIFISKLIKFLLNKVPNTVKIGICGLLIASPFAIVFSAAKEYKIDFSKIWIYPVGLITLIVGIVIAIIISKAVREEKEIKDKFFVD